MAAASAFPLPQCVNWCCGKPSKGVTAHVWFLLLLTGQCLCDAGPASCLTGFAASRCHPERPDRILSQGLITEASFWEILYFTDVKSRREDWALLGLPYEGKNINRLNTHLNLKQRATNTGSNVNFEKSCAWGNWGNNAKGQ